MADEPDGDDDPAEGTAGGGDGGSDVADEPAAPDEGDGDPGGASTPEPDEGTGGDGAGSGDGSDPASGTEAGDEEFEHLVDTTDSSAPKNIEQERKEREERIKQTQREQAMAEGTGDDDGWNLPGADGPDTDQEMPLTAHVEEMLKRLAVVVAVAGLVSLLTFPFAERVINVLWNSILPAGETTRPRLYGILELMFTKLKVASLAGLIVALPVLVYETYQFMRPGLYPHERRYYLAAIPTSLVLAVVGVTFAYVIVLPAIFLYFTGYTQGVAGIGFALGRTFNLILLLMGYMALVFQIPLFLMLAMMMGLVTRRWLAERRLIFWGSFLGISFIFSPDPTGMAPILVAVTMIALFEGTLLLTRWTGRGRRRRGSADV